MVVLLSATACAAEDYVFPLDEDAWNAIPEWTGDAVARDYSHAFADGVLTLRAEGGTMIWGRFYEPPVDIGNLRYLTIRYRVVSSRNPEQAQQGENSSKSHPFPNML